MAVALLDLPATIPNNVQRAALGDWPDSLQGIEIREMIVFIEASAIDGPQRAAEFFSLYWDEEQEDLNWEHYDDPALIAELVVLDIDSIDVPQHGCADPEVAAHYATLTTQAPPVFLNGNALEDGHHRLAAALARGETQILAYRIR